MIYMLCRQSLALLWIKFCLCLRLGFLYQFISNIVYLLYKL
ncbi:unnamed protein product [Coffea canephora]|uniref:Uncharacterized protein n=1 Tax=Coffea canephora TaxID=49390 RepID=A0A068VA10_COFCA|nr:unnamed protein product [Coffea canephora]